MAAFERKSMVEADHQGMSGHEMPAIIGIEFRIPDGTVLLRGYDDDAKATEKAVEMSLATLQAVIWEMEEMGLMEALKRIPLPHTPLNGE